MSFDVGRFAVALLQSMPDAVVYADAEGVIRFWNEGAERMFGHAGSDALGQSLDIIIPVSLRQRHWDGYGKTMQTGVTRATAPAICCPCRPFARMARVSRSSSRSRRSTTMQARSSVSPRSCAMSPSGSRR